MRNGLIHVYTGDGKGKTTAALGLAMRAAGWGWRVLIIQFLKGKSEYGEMLFINELRTKNLGLRTKKKKPLIEIESFGRGEFVSPKKPTKADFEEVEKGLEGAMREVGSGKWDMIILDEINVAIKFGLIPLSKVLDLIKNKPKNLELVLTGRAACSELIKRGDYVTELKEVKHPYKKGIKARTGIEY